MCSNLHPISSILYLGIILKECLSFSHHVDYVSVKLNRTLILIAILLMHALAGIFFLKIS